jgi:hypothetical protein
MRARYERFGPFSLIGWLFGQRPAHDLAVEFATRIGRERVISISEASHLVVTVWYWDDEEGDIPTQAAARQDERIQKIERLDGR